MDKLKLIGIMVLEGVTFIIFIVVCYMLLAGLCLSFHSVEACSN
jgi:hypothetical protein